MEPEQRRQLERIAYGRDSSEAEREEAARHLRAAAVAEVIRVEPTVEYEEPAPKRLPRAVWWWSAAVAVVVALGVASVLVLTPQPRAAEPRAVGVLPLREIEQVGTDLLANPPDERTTQITEMLAEPGTPVAATALGGKQGNTAFGVLTDEGMVCMNLWMPGGGGTGHCVTGDEFEQDGIVIDRGAWQVTWFADGTVVWDGI
jgi:hypothetical protein